MDIHLAFVFLMAWHKRHCTSLHNNSNKLRKVIVTDISYLPSWCIAKAPTSHLHFRRGLFSTVQVYTTYNLLTLPLTSVETFAIRCGLTITTLSTARLCVRFGWLLDWRTCNAQFDARATQCLWICLNTSHFSKTPTNTHTLSLSPLSTCLSVYLSSSFYPSLSFSFSFSLTLRHESDHSLAYESNIIIVIRRFETRCRGWIPSNQLFPLPST